MDYKVKLDVFEGPLDLLLYLIKKEELEISEVSVAQVANQYLEFITLMKVLDLRFAGEYLVIASTLVHIKSKSLLPEEEEPEEVSEESRDLLEKLMEYKKYKEAAVLLQEREQERLSVFTRPETETASEEVLLDVNLFDLLTAFSKVLSTFEAEDPVREIIREEYTVQDKIRHLQDMLCAEPAINFTKIFEETNSKMEAVVTFLAILELIKLGDIKVRQTGEFGEIYVYRKTHAEQPAD